MTKTIWKYSFDIDDEFVLEMPEGARVLHVAMQGRQSCLWAVISPERSKVKRRFSIVGTGHPMPDRELQYCGTFQVTGSVILVFHLFEDIEFYYDVLKSEWRKKAPDL